MRKKASIIFPKGFNTISGYQDFWNEVKEHPERFTFTNGTPIRNKE